MIDWNQLIKTFLNKNMQINLSAIRDENGVMVKHIQDSLELEHLIGWKQGMSVADIGTGGGFPLMVLAISHPECNFVGIDSVRKKTIAVGNILDELGVKNVKMVWSRIEEFKMQTFDLVTARAVAYSDKLLDRSNHLVKKGGRIAMMKQVNDEEKQILLDKAADFGFSLEEEHRYQLFDGDISRVIYILRK